MRERLLQTLLARVALTILLVLVSSNVFAYLDPSTGSMVVTAIVGLFASIALALKTYWYKLKSLFRRAQRRPSGIGKNSSPKE